LKDRWLYVAGGPLAGKQFILYKQETVFGSQQSADIYLFKDPSILPEHAVLSMLGTKAVLRAAGTVIVNGQSVQETPLRSGDKIQIGRYVFDYREKQKAS
jgi:pSer/pThr/pTyr-binding forkhead associated (FHA) protein